MHLYNITLRTFYINMRLYSSHKITATQNEVTLSYYEVRGLYFLAVIFAATIVIIVLALLSYLTVSITIC